MTDDRNFDRELFSGLQALADSAFPKRCSNCGRSFASATEFLSETQGIMPSVTGLKQSEDDDGTIIVEAFRNCPCGSTLLDFFTDRRDFSEAGLIRRKKFGELLVYLVENGLARETARSELIKVLRGEMSEVLKNFHPLIKSSLEQE